MILHVLYLVGLFDVDWSDNCVDLQLTPIHIIAMMNLFCGWLEVQLVCDLLCVWVSVVAMTCLTLDNTLTPIVEGFVILKKNPDYEEES